MENNPLRQYFRRPAVYIRLPSEGKDYEPGVVDMPDNGELPIYPMTAIDEISARTPDALFNGITVVDLIKSCVPNILDPWEISSNDLDAILIGIKAAGGGENLEVESSCPKCSEVGSYGINLSATLAAIKPGDYSQVLPLGDLKIKFKPLRYKDINEAALAQFEVQKMFDLVDSLKEDPARQEDLSKKTIKKTTLLTMGIVAKAIDFIETPSTKVSEYEHIFDYLQKCDKTAYTEIRDFNSKLRLGSQLKPLDIQCSNCQHKYEQPFTINPSDFFG